MGRWIKGLVICDFLFVKESFWENCDSRLKVFCILGKTKEIFVFTIYFIVYFTLLFFVFKYMYGRTI